MRLPVYSLERSDLGLRVILRDNFSDWKISVVSVRPIESEVLKFMFDPESTYLLESCYFEGFPKDLVFGPYAQDHHKFSACIRSKYMLYAMVFELMRAVGGLTAVGVKRST
jgi:hypothetical protein